MKVSKAVTDKMLKENVIKSCEEVAVYKYGIENGLYLLINLVISILIATLLRKGAILIVFLISYMPLRAYSGGWHFSSKKICCIASNGVILLILISINDILIQHMAILLTLMALSVGYLWAAPQKDSTKRRLDTKERYIFNRGKRSFLLIVTVLMCLLIAVKEFEYASALIAATALTAVLLLIEPSNKKPESG